MFKPPSWCDPIICYLDLEPAAFAVVSFVVGLDFVSEVRQMDESDEAEFFLRCAWASL